MKETIYYIEDDFHGDMHGKYKTFDEAINELERMAHIPWGKEPNICPCGSDQDCVRHYYIGKGVREKGSYMFEENKILKWLIMSKEGVQWQEPKED